MRTMTAVFTLIAFVLLLGLSTAYGQDSNPISVWIDDGVIMPEDEPFEIDDPVAHNTANFLGSNVVNMDGDIIGSIDSLVIDFEEGRILYALLSFGGFLGIGAELFGVSWDAMDYQWEDGIFLLDMSVEELQEAEGLDPNNLPGIGEQVWGVPPIEEIDPAIEEPMVDEPVM